MIYLAAVTHDIKSNTLEATWLEETETELKRVKCRNYSVEQKQEFADDIDDMTVAMKYIIMAGW